MARTGFIQSLYRGIRERSSDFRFDVFARQYLPVPPREEQDQIVRYLDWQVSKINRLIAAKRKEISLFEEMKIHQTADAVLHGVKQYKKYVETQEFGSIPAHWQIHPNKRLFRERVEHSEMGTETLLSVSKHYGVKPSADLAEDEQYATIKPALSLAGYKVVHRNDLVMNIMRARNGSYTLFESLNNRGMPLTAVDLIKNLLLAKLDLAESNSMDYYFARWREVLSNLGDDYSVQERFFRQNYNAFRGTLNIPFRKDDRQYPLGIIATRCWASYLTDFAS